MLEVSAAVSDKFGKFVMCKATNFAYGQLGRLILQGRNFAVGYTYNVHTRTYEKVAEVNCCKFKWTSEPSSVPRGSTDVYSIEFKVPFSVYLEELSCRAYNQGNPAGMIAKFEHSEF